jgi:CheY-like chemotaxis protein
MTPNRIMVVDDFKEWRLKVCSILEESRELLVVGEASDGAEAVQKAQELQPDLIVLDIGLPKLSGIEAAPRISELSPGTKLFSCLRTMMLERYRRLSAQERVVTFTS